MPLIYARVRIAQGQPDEALGLLAPLLQGAERDGLIDRLVELLVLQALAHAARGRGDQAIASLERGLALAEPGGYIRVFVDEGAPVAMLLGQSAARRAQNDPARAYVDRLLAAFPETMSNQVGAVRNEPDAHRSSIIVQPLPEPLTERETEVLRLLAAGMSSPDIAQHFVVSINTVKTQIKSIYSKLGAHSRDEALAKARALHLLR